jgi:hypothetical protein
MERCVIGESEIHLDISDVFSTDREHEFKWQSHDSHIIDCDIYRTRESEIQLDISDVFSIDREHEFKWQSHDSHIMI